MEDTNQAAQAASAPAKPSGPAKGNGPGKKQVASVKVLPAATPARPRRRHWLLLATFGLFVLLPLVVVAFYMYAVARDQYASHVGFSVRTEEVSSAVELLGGITELSGSSSSDTDILYEFIQSQQMVRAIARELDLPAIYRRDGDPVFTLGEDTRIEALADYWQRMVKVFYDRSGGLIEVRVLAFDPDDAHSIATAIFANSSAMINELSAIARADATRYAEEELMRSQERLRAARQALTAFRNRTGIIDPSADIQGQMGVVNALQQSLAQALIELQSLLDEGVDPNGLQVERLRSRIEAIRKQIAAERDQFARDAEEGSGGGAQAFSRLLEEYEGLIVDLEFAESASLSARTAYESALAEAQRQSRYLASYINPTRAETPEYPQRGVIVPVSGVFLLILWAIGAMIYYSLRDRR
ncbi:sugar transporter [Aestuariicoccus sp. MJ-SS9]|uniref:sugar transporter n=1 Tax=Aestuariicoccus sp. MJ-SS9 TaxID=3079855 RepID=UPI0029087F60|nr:sugar transporter [Aestuariicoccus sp. MJ-SS9]MDU8912157.1 sugar transporter [Aestuariicoccus sp. MJ-SS9]